jgi:hypothetical protein
MAAERDHHEMETRRFLIREIVGNLELLGVSNSTAGLSTPSRWRRRLLHNGTHIAQGMRRPRAGMAASERTSVALT